MKPTFTFYEVACNGLEKVCTILCQAKIDFRYDMTSESVSFVLGDDWALKIDDIKSNIGVGFKIRNRQASPYGSVHSFFSK